jgi:TonB-linked SusC/RagA family outer membrane protein
MRSKLKTDGLPIQRCHHKTSMQLWGWRIFLVLFIMQGFTLSTLFAQNPRVSLNIKDVPITNVFQEIKQQTKMTNVYNVSDVDPNQKVNVEANNEAVTAVLDRLLVNTDLTYLMEGNYIVFAKKGATPAAQVSTDPVTVNGTVVDKSGDPLIGASIVIKGTTKSTSADIDGKFTLSGVIPDQVLVVSYLGYDIKEITVGSQTTYNVVLEESATILDEVVVTALGIKRSEKALSYNVQTVNANDVTAVKSANLINSLAGKVAGVTINTSSSGVGGATKVVMRGSKSIAASNNALYVIDGIPMYNNIAGNGSGGRGDEFASKGATEAIADLNPEDIESISVLTGAAAAALYGNEGANGAVVITTKKGLAGKLEVIVSSNTEFLNPLVLPRFQNRYGTGDLQAGSVSKLRSWGHLLVPENYTGYDPANDFFKTGTVFTNTVSVATGTEKNQTYFSAAAVNSDGIIPNNQYDRYNFTFRNTTKFLNDKMTLDVGGNYIIQQDQNMINNGVYGNPITSVYLFPRSTDFDMIRAFERYDPSRGINTQYWDEIVGSGEYVMQNPYWIAYRNLKNNNKKRYIFNAALNYEIFDWLDVSGHARVDNTNNDFIEKYYASTNETVAKGVNGHYGITKTNDRQVYADVLANINKRFGDDFSLQVNLGASINDLKYDALNVNGPLRDNAIPNMFNVFQLDPVARRESQDGWRSQSQAVFASAEVGYKGAYYLTVTGRNDWESALAGTEASSFFYPSVGFSTVLSEILPLPEQIDYMKFRASFAQVGTPIPRNIAREHHEWNYENGAWDTESVYPLRKFDPERTTSWELGLTARFLDHFNLDFAWYYANTINQTFRPGISPSAGYGDMYIQTGNVRNTGIELSLGYSNTWGGLKWSSNFVFSANRNKIIELADNVVNPVTGEIFNIDKLDIKDEGHARAHFILTAGGTLGDLYSTQDLRRDSNGNIYVDADGKIQSSNTDNPIYLGSVFPKANLSWRNDLSWKNIHLGFMFSGRIGGVVYSATQAALDVYGVSETSATARDNGGVIINGGDVIDAETWFTTIGSGDGLPQYYTYSATNFRLQEFSIGYTIPKKILKNVADITVSLVAHNLLMIYNKAPFDPEAVATTGNYSQGIDHFMMPSLRNIGFNIKLTF